MARVLVVEDNEVGREGLSRYLRRRGFEVLVAVDGRQALEAARAGGPDLILMDMSLPILDGWEATRLLKADEATRHIPVIALTAHAMAGDQEKALEAGCDDYDTKPVEFDRLLGKIQSLRGKKAGPPDGPGGTP
jgi:CheY-like chemotaxis protein